jgi:hypothetical protein
MKMKIFAKSAQSIVQLAQMDQAVMNVQVAELPFLIVKLALKNSLMMELMLNVKLVIVPARIVPIRLISVHHAELIGHWLVLNATVMILMC